MAPGAAAGPESTVTVMVLTTGGGGVALVGVEPWLPRHAPSGPAVNMMAMRCAVRWGDFMGLKFSANSPATRPQGAAAADKRGRYRRACGRRIRPPMRRKRAAGSDAYPDASARST